MRGKNISISKSNVICMSEGQQFMTVGHERTWPLKNSFESRKSFPIFVDRIEIRLRARAR